MFSPKLRNKMMKRELKATKNMFQSLTDDLKDLQSTSIKIKKEIVDKMNELFEKYDGLILPVGSGPAKFIEGSIFLDFLFVIHMNQLQIFF